MISVVIPLYNKQNSIAETIKCVKRQTYTDFECIIVNDGSTDESLKNATDAIRGDDRFIILQQKNKGVSAARNFGVTTSKHDYVAFLDADDYWEKEYLEEVVELVHRFPECVLLGVGWRHKNRNTVEMVSKDLDVERKKVDNFWENRQYTFWTSATVVRKQAILDTGGFDERVSYGEDIDLWYRLALNYPSSVAFSTRVLSYWMQDSENRLFLSTPSFNRNLVCYIGKYDMNMESNICFRRFLTPIIAWLLFPYLDSEEYQKNKTLRLRVKIIRSRCDITVLSLLTILRLYFPWLFRLKRRLFRVSSFTHSKRTN